MPQSETKLQPHESLYSPDLDGFDVTCVIGRVLFGGNGDPYELALQIIAQHHADEHHADGSYKFPSDDGGVVKVEIVTQ